jgi:hypothetical protein
MTDTIVARSTASKPPRPFAERYGVVFLAAGLAFVLAFRLVLYQWNPDRTSNFDVLYDAAAQLLSGGNPYSTASQGLLYPLPAVLLAIPFTVFPLALARPIFDVLVGWAFVFTLWKYSGRHALLAVLSGAYLFAMLQGQTTPLMVAASLIPALGFLLAVKPNTAAALWIARPSRIAAIAVSILVALSIVVQPSWLRDWWLALQQDNAQLLPPILRPFGLILLFAALRWRSPEGRLILAIAFIPQTALPYELVPLALIPANLLEMGIYVAGSWIAFMVTADRMALGHDVADWAASSWPATLLAVYLPMLFLVLRPMLKFRLPARTSTSPRRVERARKIEKERRRPNRLADDELKVQVTDKGAEGFSVTVTHLPTKQSVTESAPTREAAVRKAQDKLAGVLAEVRRASEKGATEPR